MQHESLRTPYEINYGKSKKISQLKNHTNILNWKSSFKKTTRSSLQII